MADNHDLIWAQCPIDNWQQLISRQGLYGLDEIRDPPECVFRSDSSDSSRPTSSVSSSHSHQETYRPQEPPTWSVKSADDLPPTRTNPVRRRSVSPPALNPNRKAPVPTFHSSPPSRNQKLRGVLKDLDRAEASGKAVEERIKELKKRTSSVINVV